MIYKQAFENQAYKKIIFFKLLKINNLGIFIKKIFL